MAATPRQQATDLSDRLLRQAHSFPFQQAVRLLHHVLRLEAETPLSVAQLDDAVRCRPELSLAFTPADIAAIDLIREEPKRFQLTLTFLGLYGSSSPLPTFYTEDLLDEWREGQALCRHFFDLINHGLYTLFFRGWAKYQLAYQLHENCTPRTREHLFALLGLPAPLWREQLRTPLALLRYIGLTSQNPRSAAGLRAMLRDWLDNDDIEVEQCVRRRVILAPEQRLLLGKQGHYLGEDSVLGLEMEERGSSFRLHLKVMSAARFHSLLPDRPAFAELVELVHLYVDRPLVWDMLISLPEETVHPTIVGGGEDGTWAQLGWNTWLHTEGALLAPEQTRVRLLGPEIGASRDTAFLSACSPMED